MSGSGDRAFFRYHQPRPPVNFTAPPTASSCKVEREIWWTDGETHETMQPKHDTAPDSATGAMSDAATDAMSDSPSDAASEPAYEPPMTQMPAALVIALVLQLVGSFVVRIVLADLEQSRGFDSYTSVLESVTRWELLGRALPFVCLLLALSGAGELLRGGRGRARLGAQIMIGALLAGLAARIGVELERVPALASAAAAGPFDPWTGAAHGSARLALWAYAACWPAVTAGLLVAGWRDRGVRRLALPLLVSSLIPGCYGVIDLRRLLDVTRQGALAAGMMGEIFFVATFLFALFRSAPIADPFGGWERAARSLERAAAALRLWLLLSIGEVVVLMVVWRLSTNSGAMQWLDAHAWSLWGPMLSAAAVLLLVRGAFGAASLLMIDAPRLRLLFAGSLFAATAALGILQMLSASSPGAHAALELPLLLPVLGIGAVALYVASLHGFATLLNAAAVAQPLSHSIGLSVVLLVAHAGCLQLASSNLKFAAAFTCLAIGVAAKAFVLFKMRAFTLQIAERLRRREKLPAATLRQR